MAVRHIERIDSDEVGLEISLGTGSYGEVLYAPELEASKGREFAVVKRFKKRHLPVSLSSLKALIALRLSASADDRSRLDQVTTWPTAYVADSTGHPIGLTMPKIPDRFYMDLSLRMGERRVPSELQHFIQDDAYLVQVGLPRPQFGEKLAVSISLCRTVGLMHKLGVVIGDLSSTNVLVARGGDQRVMLIDCDSFRLLGRQAIFTTQPRTADWTTPENDLASRHDRGSKTDPFLTPGERAVLRSQARSQSTATDLYKLGLAIGRIFSQIRTGTEFPLSSLPPEAEPLLKRSLADQPASRPSAREWHEALAAAARRFEGNASPTLRPGGSLADQSRGMSRDANGNWTIRE